jgi:cytochrome c
MKFRTTLIACTLALPFTFSSQLFAESAPRFDADLKAAQSLLRASKCSKCHEVDKTKKGKSFQQIAEEHKDDSDADAIASIVKHISEPSQVEVDDEKVDHGLVKTRDQSKIENLAKWILSQ